MFTDKVTRCITRCGTRARSAVLPLFTLFVVALLPGCGGGGGSPGLTGGAPPPAPPPPPSLSIGLAEVASGLSSPVFLTSPPDDRRQFIVERDGRIRILRDGTLLTEPFLDISRFISSAGEGGLLSLAFDPGYASNGYFYVMYTDINGDIVVERFSASGNPNQADPTSGLTIIDIAHPIFRNHVGGLASFGPDGFLYLGTGDGGGAGDPQRNAGNLGSLLGKILRLDVGASTVTRPYAIPRTNPFAGQTGRRGEIWAFGLRNPWRFTFDANRMFIADVGEDRREEVDIAALDDGGLDFGWSVMEGSLCFNAANCSTAGLVLPAFEYDHGANDVNGCAIIGGFVYRGRAMPELAGRYFYSDLCGAFLKSFLADGSRVSEETDWKIADVGSIVSFGRDADGELYLLTSGGKVYRIVRTSAAPG